MVLITILLSESIKITEIEEKSEPRKSGDIEIPGDMEVYRPDPSKIRKFWDKIRKWGKKH